MSMLTEPSAARAGTPTAAAKHRRWTAELIIAGIGVALSLIAMGGFTLVMNAIDLETFEEAVMPALLGGSTAIPVDQAYEMGQTLAAWFGFSLVVLLLLSAAGIALARRRPHRRIAGWWFLAAGLVCLFGSQLLLFPIAFLFFVSAGMFALRPLSGRSPR